MNATKHTVKGPILAGAFLLFLAAAAPAETICTYIIQAPEFPMPMDERESARQVQARLMSSLIAEGDKKAGAGKLAAAVEAYGGVFRGYRYAGVPFNASRCLPMDFYQGAADKLHATASELAKQRRAKGYLLDERHENGDIRRGALKLYLTSNQYDDFVNHAISYAKSELLQRDIDGELVGLVKNRLDELKRTRESGTEAHYRQYVNDLTPLLDEELAAFDKLAGFEEQLRAHLAPLHPKITDHWLAEEAKNFATAAKTDGAMPKGMLHGQATGALEAGIRRLARHPQQVARLKARANLRGEALMKMASADAGGEALMGFMMKDYYAYARDYFEIAGNQEQYAKADRLSEERQESVAKKMEASIQTDVEKMQKSEEEKSAFQDETDAMAAEFGFDLDE
ncbi:MAG: hypothetical protein WBM80_06250 [Woeseiaceae bacterium]